LKDEDKRFIKKKKMKNILVMSKGRAQVNIPGCTLGEKSRKKKAKVSILVLL
jgi:hypothetical protein